VFVGYFDLMLDLCNAVAGAVSVVICAISGVLESVALPGEVAAALRRDLGAFTADAEGLLSAPSTFADAMLGLVAQLSAGLQQVNAPLTFLLEVFSADFGTRPPDDTPTARAEQQNFDGVVSLVKRAVLTEAALVAVGKAFVTYDEAVATRDAIADLIDQHTADVADDAFPALQDVRRDLVQAVPGEDSDLPHLVTYTPHTTLPSLVVAHLLYGNLDREQDVIDRNRVSHPGFISGGVALQVLADE
jgi:hypothetical protein